MTQIISNTLETGAVEKKILQLVKPGQHLRFAVPFFTNHKLVEKLLNKKCKLDLVVRLCAVTKEDSLASLLKHKHSSGVLIRYMTDAKFHSKLYIFDDKDALFGSANLTGRGVSDNDEICVHVRNDHIAKLNKIFKTYWNNAEILSHDTLENCRRTKKQHKKLEGKSLDQKISDALRKRSSSKSTQQHTSAYRQKFRNTRQEFEQAFNELRKIYQNCGRRKFNASDMPLHIEIDQFLSYLAEEHGSRQEYSNTAPLSGKGLEKKVARHYKAWRQHDWEGPRDYTSKTWKALNSAFGSARKINSMNMEEIRENLLRCYSFKESYGWCRGKSPFRNNRQIRPVRTTLIHLLHGEGHHIDRMADCINDKKRYRLYGFAGNSIQELYGWVNKENAPMYNERVWHSLRFLGFNINKVL